MMEILYLLWYELQNYSVGILALSNQLYFKAFIEIKKGVYFCLHISYFWCPPFLFVKILMTSLKQHVPPHRASVGFCGLISGQISLAGCFWLKVSYESIVKLWPKCWSSEGAGKPASRLSHVDVSSLTHGPFHRLVIHMVSTAFPNTVRGREGRKKRGVKKEERWWEK